MKSEPSAQHHWLMQLVGEWSVESECDMGPGTPPMTWTGREVVRSLGGLWTIAEGQHGSGDDAWTSVMTLGFDPDAGRFRGTFIANMATYLWVYDGSLDESKGMLTLEAEGPRMDRPGMGTYEDIIEFVSPDERTLRSRLRGDDGEWRCFLKATYRRA